MTNFDEYFTNNDEPLAENLNDALLLSNVFDITVPVEMPRMFNNQAWNLTTSVNRKASVAITQVKEATGLSVSTLDDESVITGTGTLKLMFYPNFNSFGSMNKLEWENTGTITVSIYKADGTLIVDNVSSGTLSPTPELANLQNFELRFTLTNATLKTVKVTMNNSDEERYGAEVGISDVTGLQSSLDAKVNISDIKDNLASTDTNKPLSANQGKILKTTLDTKANTTNNITSYENIETDAAWAVAGNYFKGMIRNGFAHIVLQMQHNPSAAVPTDSMIIGSTNNLKFKPLIAHESPVKLYDTSTGREIATIKVSFDTSYQAVIFRLYYATFGASNGVVGSFIYPIEDY